MKVMKTAPDRIEALKGKLHCYVTVTLEATTAQVWQAEAEIGRGEVRGPLHGVPIAVKNVCWTKCVRTTAGMTIHWDHIPNEDAMVVRQLAEVGAVLLDKLHLTEGTYADHHPIIGQLLNPWGPDVWSGASFSGSGAASQSGSATTLSALTRAAPYSFLRPPAASWDLSPQGPGQLARRFELAVSLDYVGRIADCGAMLGVIAGSHPLDSTAAGNPVPSFAVLEPDVRGLRVGCDPAWGSPGVDDETRHTVLGTLGVLRELGATVIDVAVPNSSQIPSAWIPNCGVETVVTSDDEHLGVEHRDDGGLLHFTCPFDTTGSPTITMICAFTPFGLPIGFQLVGCPFEEDVLVRAGAAYQAATEWHPHHSTLS